METVSSHRLFRFSRKYGLIMRGGFEVCDCDDVPDVGHSKAGSLVLFGNAGSSVWRIFSQSAEYRDGRKDPLNRWSRRIGNEIAEKFSGLALFPFGEPLRPFLKWAKKAESLRPSKLGMVIHPQYGLWHAYRFAIAFPVKVSALPVAGRVDDICAKCSGQPCLKACPADAFSENGYDVARCISYLKEDGRNSCMNNSCQARLACPEGVRFRYRPDHARFHMAAFYSAVAGRRG